MSSHLIVSLSVSLTRGAEHGTLVNGLRRLSSMAAQFQKRNLVICLSSILSEVFGRLD